MADPYNRGLCDRCVQFAVRYRHYDGKERCWDCLLAMYGQERVHDAIVASSNILSRKQYGCVGVKDLEHAFGETFPTVDKFPLSL